MVVAGCQTRFGADLERPDEPVVLTGAQLPGLAGAAPSEVVAFAWDGSTWHQVPVQVDERDDVPVGQIYHLPTSSWPKFYNTSTPFTMNVYTPPAAPATGYSSLDTYTPTDSNPDLDSDDEVVFMASDTGKSSTGAAAPAGVDAASRSQVTVSDPLDPGKVGYVTLFRSTQPSLTGGSAGGTGVTNSFALNSGTYKATYKMGNSSLAPNNTWGFNPETTTISTPAYTLGYADRWLNDSLSIVQSGASGQDILDRSMYYVPAGCFRTEDTFDGADDGEGAFVVSLAGPVRAIRSVFGANSYKFTLKTDLFYPRRQDTIINLQGHAGIPSYGTAIDLSTGLSGMTYVDPRNSGGLPIDGVSDSFVPTSYVTGSSAPPSDPWSMVRGPAGSLVSVARMFTDIDGLTVRSVHTDVQSPSPAPCTGDASSWGRNGVNVLNMPFSAVTDPTLTSSPKYLTVLRSRVFAGPNLPNDRAAKISDEVLHPLTVSVTG